MKFPMFQWFSCQYVPLNELPWARALHFDVDDAATAVGSVHSSKQAVAAEYRLWIF